MAGPVSVGKCILRCHACTYREICTQEFYVYDKRHLAAASGSLSLSAPLTSCGALTISALFFSAVRLPVAALTAAEPSTPCRNMLNRLQ